MFAKMAALRQTRLLGTLRVDWFTKSCDLQGDSGADR
jgi:hypothetical protein